MNFKYIFNIIFFSTTIYAGTQDANSTCIKLQKINLDENKILNKRIQKELFEQYLGQCIDANILKKTLYSVSQFYIENGYITTKPYLKEQNIKEGQIDISVSKGLIENIVNNDTNRSDGTIWTAFIFQKGGVLNLRDLETSLEMINRVPSVNAKFNILPGKEEGTSIVDIKTEKSTPYHLTLGAVGESSIYNDNPYLTADFSLDNPFNINDIFTLKYNTQNFQKAYQASSGSELDYSFPIGSYLFNYTWFNFKYNQRIIGLNGTYQASGDIKGSTGKISKVIYRNQKNKLTFALGIQHKQTESYFSGELIDVSSYSTTQAELDAIYLLVENWGQLSTTYSFSRGTDWFGSRNDSYASRSSSINENAKLLFSKHTLDASLIFYFPNPTYRLDSNAHLQYSADFLYDNDKLKLGDYYSVRGYSSSYSGNNGWYSHNDFLKTFTPAFSLKFFQTLSPFVGLDYGEIQCQRDNINSCGKMIGSTVGFKTDSKKISTEFSWSRALKKVSGQKLENLFRYSLTLKF